MSKQLRAVRSEDLVVGKEYYDIPEISEETCVLRFVGRDEYGHLLFDRVSGSGAYHWGRSGKIPFSEGGFFYEQIEA